ncbi:MAG: cyclodeaminase/cyclohydrolase family protein [Candidatus Omnitrophota bacterium]
MYIEKPIAEYLNDLAAKKPAPGGGSAAALTGALGAGLLSMVANYTVGKEKYRHVEDDVRKALDESERLREELSRLVDEDVAVYKIFSEAYKTKDAEKIEEASIGAAGVPLGICMCCNEGMRIAAGLVDTGNVNLISDIGVAAELFAAAYESAKMNVDINLKNIGNEVFIENTRRALEPIDRGLIIQKDEIVKKVRRLMS